MYFYPYSISIIGKSTNSTQSQSTLDLIHFIIFKYVQYLLDFFSIYQHDESRN